MDEKNQLTIYLRDQLAIELPEQMSMDELQEKLAGHIHYLINHDFERLINLLYTVDVSESKLKNLLQEDSNTDAGYIIATLIIERQLQKIKTRRETKQGNFDGDVERW